MKRNYKKNYRCSGLSALCLSAAVAFATACGNKAGAGEPCDDPDVQRPDSSLSLLVRALAHDDARAFASICSYPLHRNYPLKDITDSTAMVDYFHVMVDDSLRRIARDSRLDDWKYYGWRGWAFGDSTLIWYDDGIQFVEYESVAETGLRRLLAREEIMSLPPQLRESWTPVETLVQADGDRIFRIDRDGGRFRLMCYDGPVGMRDMPSLLLTGGMDVEGTVGSRIYNFRDSAGNEVRYMPDDLPPVKIEFLAGVSDSAYTVVRAYWRDYLPSAESVHQ